MSTVVREREWAGQSLVRSPRSRWWVPVVIFLAVAAAVWIVAALAAGHLPRTEHYSPIPSDFPGGPLFEPWARWDAWWYRAIVEEGYVYYPGVQSSVAFWPSYPLAISVLDPFFPSPFVAGSVVTVVSGLACAVLFHRWCAGWISPHAATTSLLLLLVYPFAWYLYGPVYADAFCMVAILGAFLAVERDRLWLAGVLGFVASAARPVGLVVAIALVLRLVERRNETRTAPLSDDRGPTQVAPDGARVPAPPFGIRVAGHVVASTRRLSREARVRFSLARVRWTDTPVLLAFGGFVAWCAYLWVRFDDPLLWQNIQSVPGWDQGSGPGTWFKVFLAEQMVGDASSPFTWSKAGQGLLALGVLALVPCIARRFGWAYAAFTFGVVMLPIVGTKDFMGTGRYLLVAFPAFAVVGEWLTGRPRLRVGVLITCGLLLAFLTSVFARGHYIA